MGRAQAAVALSALLITVGSAYGCHPTTYRIALSPSLAPIDAARPRVVFSQVRGEACGRDAVVGAIRDMKRLAPVDGYQEVVVEDMGSDDKRCARATAYPFRYGTDTSTPVIRAGDEPLDAVLVPGRALHPGHGPTATTEAGPGDAPTQPSQAAPVDCKRTCDAAAALVEPSTFKRALTSDRCQQRCQAGETSLIDCLGKATTTEAAGTCLSATAPDAPAGGQP